MAGHDGARGNGFISLTGWMAQVQEHLQLNDSFLGYFPIRRTKEDKRAMVISDEGLLGFAYVMLLSIVLKPLSWDPGQAACLCLYLSICLSIYPLLNASKITLQCTYLKILIYEAGHPKATRSCYECQSHQSSVDLIPRGLVQCM